MRPSCVSLALSASLAVLASATVLGCGNPVVDVRVDQLGDENPNVAPGPYHRPGQPCVLCHSKYEGVSPEISVGGTIFATPMKDIPVNGVKVTLIDAQGDSRTVATNCIGNFYIEKDNWDPLFPLHAEIEFEVPDSSGLTKRAVMATRINRDGSCAGCHEGTPNQGSPGWVYCALDSAGYSFPEPDASCPGQVP